MTHPDPAVIARYADPHATLDEATMWSVDVHLETCAPCRNLLATAASQELLDQVHTAITEGIAAGPPPAARPHLSVLRRWAVWQLAPWLGMTVAVLACALLLDSLALGMPSLVALLAPIAPLPGVAVAWSRRHDPAWELIATTPAAGLTVLLRRTAAVLAVIVPALALAGSTTGTSLAITLLPCLAFTAATIAVGAFTGVRRAALSLGTLWTLTVIAPAVRTAELPALLQPGTVGAWALLTAVLAGFAATRARAFRRITGLT